MFRVWIRWWQTTSVSMSVLTETKIQDGNVVSPGEEVDPRLPSLVSSWWWACGHVPLEFLRSSECGALPDQPQSTAWAGPPTNEQQLLAIGHPPPPSTTGRERERGRRKGERVGAEKGGGREKVGDGGRGRERQGGRDGGREIKIRFFFRWSGWQASRPIYIYIYLISCFIPALV